MFSVKRCTSSELFMVVQINSWKQHHRTKSSLNSAVRKQKLPLPCPLQVLSRRSGGAEGSGPTRPKRHTHNAKLQERWEHPWKGVVFSLSLLSVCVLSLLAPCRVARTSSHTDFCRRSLPGRQLYLPACLLARCFCGCCWALLYECSRANCRLLAVRSLVRVMRIASLWITLTNGSVVVLFCFCHINPLIMMSFSTSTGEYATDSYSLPVDKLRLDTQITNTRRHWVQWSS